MPAAGSTTNPRGARPNVPITRYVRTEGLAAMKGEEVMELTTEPQRVRSSSPSGQLLARSDVAAEVTYSNGRSVRLAPKVAEIIALPVMASVTVRCIKGTGTLTLTQLGYAAPGSRDSMQAPEYTAALRRGKLRLYK